PLELANSVLQKLAIEFVPHGRDVTALLGAENVSRPANLEVPHRDFEAGPQFAELFDRLEPFGRLVSQRLALFEQEITVRPMLVPSNPTAQLMQIGEPVS